MGFSHWGGPASKFTSNMPPQQNWGASGGQSMSNIPPHNWGGGQWGIGPCGWNVGGPQGTTPMVAPRPQTCGSSYPNFMQNFECFFSQGFFGMPNPVIHPIFSFLSPNQATNVRHNPGVHLAMFEGS
jgi:hypothetical protein